MFALFAFLRAPSAYAQTAADRETARLLMDRGDEQVEQGDFDAALTLYLGAHEIMRVPTTGIEVARTYARIGRLVEARDASLEVLRLPAAPDEPQPFKVAREEADQLARQLAQEIPLLIIELSPTSALSAVSLSIDARAIPSANIGLPYSLNPTEHRVQLTAHGYASIDQRVTLARGERRALRLALQPVAGHSSPPHTSSKQSVFVAHNPPATKAFGAPNPRSLPQRSPSHIENRRVTWPLWLGVSVGGAGLIVGTVAGLVSLDRTRDAKAYCDGNLCPPSAKDDRDAALLTANISNVGFALGALGAVTGLASWLLWQSESDQLSATVSAEVSPASRGCLLKWSGAL